jgi:hypothetical protein
MRPLRRANVSLLAAAVALVCGLSASVGFAYTVVLKDGSKITTKQKYRVQGKRAVLLLPNGSEAFLDLAEIDTAKTEQANKEDYGTAVVLDGGPQPTQAAPAPRERRLQDLIKTQGDTPDAREPVRRPPGTGAIPTRPETTAPTRGADAASSRRPATNSAAATALLARFRADGIDEVELSQGSASSRIRADVVTPSEATVFRALTIAASALLEVRKTQATSISAIELTMATPSRERAGTFVLTPEQAEQLAGGKIEVSEFFVANVQF